MTSLRLQSDLSVTDVFCGAGGNTIGAKRAGLNVRVGLNHWQRAIDTYRANNPEVDVVERVDVSLCDPRRFPHTDIGIFSPECTTHSPAGGNRHRGGGANQASLFGNPALDPATVRSRVTMFDVVRFAEYHRYRIVVVENVVEATRWELFADWLQMMGRLGYSHRILSLNSMFFHPTPQSRDRIYVVFWRKGNTPPVLEYRPVAPCPKCGVIEAVQAWKNGRTIGKHKRQYAYVCTRCAVEVTPFYYAALNALDFSVPADRIGDRKKALRPRTMERIQFGLEKYGRRTLVVNIQGGIERAGGVVGIEEALPTQFASCPHEALVQPGFVVETSQTHSARRRPRGLDEPLPTLGAQLTSALVQSFIVTAGSRDTVSNGTDPMPTQTGSERLAMVVPLRTNGRARTVDDALPTMAAAGTHHLLVQGAAQISMRDANAMRVAGLDSELMTQGCGPQQAVMSTAPFLVSLHRGGFNASGADAPAPTQMAVDKHALVQPSPFLVSYYGTQNVSPVDEAVPTVTGLDRHALIEPELKVEDCYFRMLQPHEIGAAMAFPVEYLVGGNKRDRVKQYGNAVTPPVMDWIIRQCAASLAPEVAA